LGGYAGWFDGDVYVNGVLSALNKQFKIDDPLDPAHKYLVHSSVESSDMLNLQRQHQDRRARLRHGHDAALVPGVEPQFRYQLTIVGTRGWNARVVKEIEHNRFTIQTDQPNVKVSWQVTGIRHDRYANAHRTQVVAPKTGADQGKYLQPELYGKPQSKAIGEAPSSKAPAALRTKTDR